MPIYTSSSYEKMVEESLERPTCYLQRLKPRDLGITSHYFAQNDFLMDVLTPELTPPATDPQLKVVVGPQGQRIIIIVHLFAGRRRNDDFHSWVDRISAQWLQGFETWTLSFDTAIHPTLGNLLGKNFARLIQVAKTGAIAASASGPPCETYSPARHLPPPSDSNHRWPRPQQLLWGIADRSLRELEQLRTGNLLYFNCDILEFQVSLRGGYRYWNILQIPTRRANAAHR